MIRFSEIHQFPDFLELFPGIFRTICPRFENFEIFRRMVSGHDMRRANFQHVFRFEREK